MEPTVLTSAGLHALLADIVATSPGGPGALDGAKLKLFVNDVDPGRAAVIGDFTLATFTGGAPIAVSAWGEAHTDAAGNANVLGPVCQWDWDSGTAETVYGVVLTDAADNLLGYARLTEPKEMDDTSDSIAIVPRITLGGEDFGTMVRVA